MSTAKFNTWQNPDGTQNYKCRAWVTFNGTGTPAIRASGNVSSITDNGTGDYTVNFTTAMQDINYCTTGACQRVNGGSDVIFGIYANDSNGAAVDPTTTQARVTMSNFQNVAIDSAFVCVAFFR
jgi:hypothetical protein